MTGGRLNVINDLLKYRKSVDNSVEARGGGCMITTLLDNQDISQRHHLSLQQLAMGCVGDK